MPRIGLKGPVFEPSNPILGDFYTGINKIVEGIFFITAW